MVHWIEEGHFLHLTRCSIPIRIISPRSIPTTQKWCKKCAYACPTKSTLCVLLLRIWPWNRRFINRTMPFVVGIQTQCKRRWWLYMGTKGLLLLMPHLAPTKTKCFKSLHVVKHVLCLIVLHRFNCRCCTN
jgi:hypothetical protein